MESSGLRRLFVTRIQKQFDCDTFIPDINPDKFRLLPEFPGVASGLQEENGLQIPLFCSSFHRLKHLHGWVSSSPGPSSSSPLSQQEANAKLKISVIGSPFQTLSSPQLPSSPLISPHLAP
ncbi:hypothetical protein HF521_014910 [Silurus meridionalis]|uniref:Uncharacterized protein n=1 Tax=Silurus meridionalis TaxID=175797 RepID=A0A8T0A9M7_SILME|nr:hypothetical protein HF521_014910 [Silurus meridionalis]